MLALRKRNTLNASWTRIEVPASEFIPYDCHWDRHTLLTKDGCLMQVLKFSGFSFETADDEDLDIRKSIRNSLLRSMATGHFQLYFHTIRKRQKAEILGAPKGAGFAKEMDVMWKNKHDGQEAFVNELYVSVIYQPEAQGVLGMLEKIQGATKSRAPDQKDRHMKEAFGELQDAVQRMMVTLKEYQPHLLGICEGRYGYRSEVLEFLSYLVNGGSTHPLQIPFISIARYLPYRRLYFGDKAIEVFAAEKQRYIGMVSVKEYCASTSAGMLDAFLQLPMEFILTQSYYFTNKQSAVMKMQTQQRRMEAAQDVAVSQIEEISEALDMAMSGHIAFGDHHLSVAVFANSPKKLDKKLSIVSGELINADMTPVREKMNLQACFWSQLPGNQDYVARKATVSSMNLASMASLHNYPTGKQVGNHWGNAVTILDTSSGTPYYFNFHVRDVGHTTIIGPTGAGKTVLMNFLVGQAQKFQPRCFFFDKDHGAEIFVRAIGGKYETIEPRKSSGMNPLQLPDEPENRAFLHDWFVALLEAAGDQVKASELDAIGAAIEGNYNLNPEDRMLSNVLPFFGLQTSGSAAARLGMWVQGGTHGGLFDNAKDTLDFSSTNNFGFEMGEVLDDKLSLAPVLLYLFHRIQRALDGTPTIIVLDEAWALIDNPYFAKKIKDWLKTLRKLNAMVIFATQSVEDAANSNISDTLIQQTATQIFLINPRATDAYINTFMLTDREFALIRGTDPASGYFLVKQNSATAVAKLDLHGEDDMLNVLSGRADTVTMVEEIIAEVGDDPDKWLPIYLERLRGREKA